MKKYSILAGFLLAFAPLSFAFAAEPPLTDQLDSLALPANQAPAGVSAESLYSVQSRYVPLARRFEIALGGANDFTPDSFMVSREVGGQLRYHLTDRFSLAASGSAVFNSLSQSGNDLLEQHGLVPDAAWAKWRADASVAFHLFYGKFRVTMDRVFYFDQYIALGGGAVGLPYGNSGAMTADVGFVFWMGRRANLRVGLKDWAYPEQRLLSRVWANHLLGHLEIGFLLNGGSSM
jgi:outer membrane beta-barrel protein